MLAVVALALLDTDVLVHPACLDIPPLLCPTVRLGTMTLFAVVWLACAWVTLPAQRKPRLPWASMPTSHAPGFDPGAL